MKKSTRDEDNNYHKSNPRGTTEQRLGIRERAALLHSTNDARRTGKYVAAYLLPLTSAAHSFGLILPPKRSESAERRKGGSVSLGRRILATAASQSPARTSLPICGAWCNKRQDTTVDNLVFCALKLAPEAKPGWGF